MREIDVGWRHGSQQAAFAFFRPRVLEAGLPGLPGRLIEVRSAFTLRLRKSPRGIAPVRFLRIEEEGGISEAAFRGLVTPILPDAQRRRDVPAVQVALNLHFVTEAEASLVLMPPVHWAGFRDWPGSLVCGRFPLRSWPRPLNAVLEWQDEGRDWVLRRGDPLALVWVQFADPAAVPRLVEAAGTPDLLRHMARIDDVSSYGRNVAPMMAEAARRRPARLLTPKEP